MAQPSPLLKADAAMLQFKAEPEGRIRVTYAGWEEAKVLLAGEGMLVRFGDQQVQAYRVEKDRGPPMEQVDELEVRRALTGVATETYARMDHDYPASGTITGDGAGMLLDALTGAGYKVVRA